MNRHDEQQATSHNGYSELVQAVAESLTVMSEMMANPRTITGPSGAEWVRALQEEGLTADDVRETTSRVIKKLKFFPTVAEFLHVFKPPEDEAIVEAIAEVAWLTAVGLVRRIGGNGSLCAADAGGDETLLWAIDQMGWVRLCQELEDENRAIMRSEFVRFYRAGRIHNASRHYVPGRAELENDAKGRDLTGELVGRPDWVELPGRRPRLQPGLRQLSDPYPAHPG